MGARDVNDKVLAAAPGLFERIANLHIIHITGQKHSQPVAAAYKSSLPTWRKNIKVVGFTPDFYQFAGAADVVVTRAGATTIAELAAQRKAVILIPAPQLAAGHQLKNAQELAKKQAVLVIPNDAGPEELLKVAAEVLESDSARKKLADKLGGLAKPDAADELADLILKVAAKNKDENHAQFSQ